jgi:hypothetical protein
LLALSGQRNDGAWNAVNHKHKLALLLGCYHGWLLCIKRRHWIVSEVPHQRSNGTYPVRCRSLRIEEFPMANNKNPNEQQPGERKPGKHHYNPGNMSGKTADLFKEDGEKQNNLDTIESREPPPHERKNR